MINPTDPAEILKQWSELQETSFKNGMRAIEIFQRRAEKMTEQFWDQTVWISEKMTAVLSNLGSVYQTGCEHLQHTLSPICKTATAPHRPTPGRAAPDIPKKPVVLNLNIPGTGTSLK